MTSGAYSNSSSISSNSGGGGGDEMSDRNASTKSNISIKTSRDDRVNIFAGIIAGVANALVVQPLDVVKSRQQLGMGSSFGRRYKNRSTFQILRQVLKEEGTRGWYRGLPLTVSGYCPTWAIYFTAYQALRDELEKNLPGRPNLHALGGSVGAGAVTSAVLNPIWVLRSRIQAQERVQMEAEYRSSLDAAKKLFQREGIGAYFKGFTTQLWGLVNVGITFPLYEPMKQFGNERIEHDNALSKLGVLIMASSLSKFVASITTYPLEVVRTRLHVQRTDVFPVKYRGTFHTMKVVVKEEGFGALYLGLKTNLWRVIPGSVATLTVYETVSSYLLRNVFIPPELHDHGHAPPGGVKPVIVRKRTSLREGEVQELVSTTGEEGSF